MFLERNLYENQDLDGEEDAPREITIKHAKMAAREISFGLHNLAVEDSTLTDLYENVYERDHNYCHCRRTEGDLQEILEHGPFLRHMDDLKPLYFPAFLANREHDIAQLITGKKEKHAQRGAIFTLYSLCSYRDHVVRVDNGIDDPQQVITNQQIYHTVVMIWHHSDPQALEDMDRFLSVQEMVQQIPTLGEENRQQLLKEQQEEILKAYKASRQASNQFWYAEEARAVAARVKRDFKKLSFVEEEEAELLNAIPNWQKYHKKALNGELLSDVEEKIDFKSLHLMAKLVAAADKLDGIAGGSFSFLRLLKTPISEARPFWSRVEEIRYDEGNLDRMLLTREDILKRLNGEKGPLERELWLQALAGRGEAPSDECRIYAEFLKAYEYLGNLSKGQDIMIVKSKLSYYLRERFKAWKGLINALKQGEGIADIEEAETKKDLKKGVIGYFRKVIGKEEKKSGKDKHKPKEKECLDEDFVFVVIMLISKLKEEDDIFSLTEEERKKVVQKMKQKADIIEKYLDEFYPQSVYGAGNPSKKSYYPPY
jgi:hypothetical protein